MAQKSKTSWFRYCATAWEVKQEYYRLAKKYHPDVSDEPDAHNIMVEINYEYERVTERLRKGQGNDTFVGKESAENAQTNDYYSAQHNNEYAEWANTEAFINAVSAIITLEGIDVEIIGCYIWVGGNTFQHKDILKEANYKWAKTHQRWNWAEYRVKSRANMSLDEIKGKYGSIKVQSQSPKMLNDLRRRKRKWRM